MSKKQIKSKSKTANLFWRIVISLVGTALILMAIVNLLLFFFGETAYANVTTRRIGGADNNSSVNRRYEWSIDYTFTDKNGKQYNGHTSRRGGDMSVKTDNKVYYFHFAPFINTLEGNAKPGLSQLVFTVIGVFLIYVMNSKKNKSNKSFKNKNKNKNNKNNSDKNYDVVNNDVELRDYDDSIEEMFNDDD